MALLGMDLLVGLQDLINDLNERSDRAWAIVVIGLSVDRAFHALSAIHATPCSFPFRILSGLSIAP